MSETLNEWLASVRESDPEFALLPHGFIPWSQWGTPVSQSKVALVTTGGVFLKHGLQQPFDLEQPYGDPSFREIPSVVLSEDLALAHGHIDDIAAQQDINVIFPLERLRDMASAGYIDAVAPFAYSFSGHITRPTGLLAESAPSVAYRLRRMGADIALIVAAGGVDHQTAAVIARSAELAGIPTVVLGNRPELLAALRVPRAVAVANPDGAILGRPGNGGQHEHILRQTLEAAWQLEGPGLVERLSG